LASDSSQHVRAALASVIMGMAPILGKVGLFLFDIFDASLALILFYLPLNDFCMAYFDVGSHY
jgi:hypothetical protein